MSAGNLLPEERHRLIRECLRADGRVRAQDLARQLGLSEDTIRRDLRDLAAAGVCRRVYGGALSVAPDGGALGERRIQAVEAKRSLARVAVQLVSSGSTLFIDAGSTNVTIANALPEGSDLVVITNAPSVAVALEQRPDIQVVMIGGPVDTRAGGTVGTRAVADARAIRADLCFLGACGVDVMRGVTAHGYEESLFKQAMVESSRTVAIAATGDKLGTAAPFVVAPIEAVGDLIVEAELDPAQLDAYAAKGVRVLRTEGPLT